MSTSYFLFPTSCTYFTLMMMIRNVNSASDSINASPKIRNVKIPGRAPGLRANASVAEAVARPCPIPQRPAAIAIPRPAASGTHWLVGPVAACAKAGDANSTAARDINTNFIVLIVLYILLHAPVNLAASGWLRLTVLAPSRWIDGSTHHRQGAPAHGNLKVFLIPDPCSLASSVHATSKAKDKSRPAT